MRLVVIVGFTDKNFRTHLKGETVEYDDEAYVTTLINRGYVEVIEPQASASDNKSIKRKASKKNGKRK